MTEKIGDKLKFPGKFKFPVNLLGPLLAGGLVVGQSKAEYCREVWYKIAIGLAQVMIGATIMTIFIYSIATGDAHAILCSGALHFFSAQGILSFNYSNGWSIGLKARHQKYAHITLQVFAMICLITGCVLILLDKTPSANVHGITGLITLSLTGINVLMSPCAYMQNTKCVIIHRIVGVLTFLTSSVCIIGGFYLEPFKNWGNLTVIIVLTVFVCFYTFIVLFNCIAKCLYVL